MCSVVGLKGYCRSECLLKLQSNVRSDGLSHFTERFISQSPARTFPESNFPLTLVKQSKSLGLVGAVRVEVQYDKVTRDIHQLPWRATPVEACHHLVGVAIQQLHHVRLVGDVEKGEVEEEGGWSRDLDGPVADTASPVLVGEVGGVDHSWWRGIISTAGSHSGCEEEHRKKRGEDGQWYLWLIVSLMCTLLLHFRSPVMLL